MFEKAIEMAGKIAEVYRALVNKGVPEDLAKGLTQLIWQLIWQDWIFHETPAPTPNVNMTATIKEE